MANKKTFLRHQKQDWSGWEAIMMTSHPTVFVQDNRVLQEYHVEVYVTNQMSSKDLTLNTYILKDTIGDLTVCIIQKEWVIE